MRFFIPSYLLCFFYHVINKETQEAYCQPGSNPKFDKSADSADVVLKVALGLYCVLVMYGLVRFYKKIKTMPLKKRLEIQRNILPILSHNISMMNMNFYRPLY